MLTLGVYALIATAMWYLGSRAVLTARLWSSYSPRLASFMDCPACVGFWWGLGASSVVEIGRAIGLTIAGFETGFNPVVVGLCMIVLVPITAGLMQRGFDSAGSISLGDE